MSQTGAIEQLTNRLSRIESEIMAIRRELKALPISQSQPIGMSRYLFADKTAVKAQMQSLFLTLAIQGKPVGAEALQDQMRQTELTANELSQSIIALREE